MDITKNELRILRHIYRKPRKRKKLLCKFKKKFIESELESLTDMNLIRHDMFPEKDSDGFYVGEIPEAATYHITHLGRIEVEANQILTPDYLITKIIVPIVIGVGSALVTALIS